MLSSFHHPTSKVHYVATVDTMELRCLGGLGENRSSMTTILNRISTQPGCKVLVHPEWLELSLLPDVTPCNQCSGLGMSQWVP